MVIHVTISVDFVRIAATRQCFCQDNIQDLVATHIQLGGGTTYQFDMLYFVGRNTLQLAVGLVALACHAFAVNENLIASATTQATARVVIGKVTACR